MPEDTATPTEAPSTQQVILNQREAISGVIRSIELLEKMVQPPIVQELVLARRHAEDARMRLGVALTYLNGQNPWTNQIQPKADEE